MKIPIGDFKITDIEKKIINEILDSNRITEGKYTKEFEKEFAKYIGTKYCIATNSGSSALLVLLLSLKEMGLKGKYIITNALSYVATANAISLAGFEPLFVDSNFTINTDEIEKLTIKYKNQIAAIFPVHLMGYPNNMERLIQICKKHKIMLLEDCAQAHGTTYKNIKVGNFGYAAIYSFYVAHNIQAGELGCVVTNDIKLKKIIKQMKANGRSCDCDICLRGSNKCKKYFGYDPRFLHDYISGNFKTTDISSAIALVQLKNADYIKQKRYENVKYLNEKLKNVKYLQLPKLDINVSYLAYPIILEDDYPYSREHFCKLLENKGIESRPLFRCIPLQPSYKHLRNKYIGKLKESKYISRQGLYLGCYQYLEKEQLDYIIRIIKEII